jgi:ankyrin repeat protein
MCPKSPLHCALHRDHGEADHSDVIRLLLRHGAEIDIWAASAMGDEARVSQMLASDPELIHASGPNHATPLHFAATGEVAGIRIGAGAPLDARQKWPPAGRVHRELRVAERLLGAGADEDAMEDYHQSTPLGWAEFQGQSEVAELVTPISVAFSRHSLLS